LVAFEALHTMFSRMKGKKGFMAIKVDMSKAYDRVEWAFLEAIMHKLDFAQRWISMIIQCVSTVSYSILVNRFPPRKLSLIEDFGKEILYPRTFLLLLKA